MSPIFDAGSNYKQKGEKTEDKHNSNEVAKLTLLHSICVLHSNLVGDVII